MLDHNRSDIFPLRRGMTSIQNRKTRHRSPPSLRGATPRGNDGGERWLVPFRRGCGGCPGVYRGTARRPFPTAQKPPVSPETGDFQQNLFVPIRRAEASDWSGSFTRLSSSTIHQARICPGPSPVRRAEASDWSGSFTRLPSSTIYQTRVWLPALPGDRSGGFTRLPSSTTHQSRVWPSALPT